ncbi:MAG: hypothetical protein IPN70_00105 [Candidatus Moraniibacteriota bacterium]|nr:MAG: hypothetical protein IPN70_00105 [Candidatus Moranbacteria bacterium]
MENLDFQKYRYELSQELRKESNKEKRKEIWEQERMTEGYQRGKELRREYRNEKEEKNLFMENLSQYAQEHYKEYAVRDIDLENLVQKIAFHREEFENEILPNVSEKQIEEAISFFEGDENTKINFLKERPYCNFEKIYDQYESKNAQIYALLETFLKAQSYDKALVENEDKEIEFLGIDSDPDTKDLKNFLFDSFGEKLLKKCLLSKIQYFSETVNIQIKGIDYILPVDSYIEWEAKMPEIKERKFRAESFVFWNTDQEFSKKFIPTPIRLYSFYGEDPNRFEYLSIFSEKEKMKQYKLGTVAHEVAHHIYEYLVLKNDRKKWEDLVEDSEYITEYAGMYKDDTIKYDEFFAEAVRLHVTSPEYLKRKFPRIEEYIFSVLESLKNDEIYG